MPEGCLMKSIMTALAPLESRHPRLGQSVCVCGWVCVPPTSISNMNGVIRQNEHRALFNYA